jgi:hypothetical protein
MELLDDMGLVESRFGLLETVFELVQDRCTVCAERTIGLEIILDTPDGTPRIRGSMEAHFGPFGDSSNIDVR